MEILKKKGKGYYMKTMDKKKASKVMKQRAFDRWSKASAKDRKALGVALANARRVKRLQMMSSTTANI